MGLFDRLRGRESAEIVAVPTMAQRRRTPKAAQANDSIPTPTLQVQDVDFVESRPEREQRTMGSVISQISDMPSVREVLTATDSSNPALRIPKGLQDAVIAVKTGPGKGGIYFDFKRVNEVSKYFPTLHSALANAGLSVGGREYPATGDIIRQVRLNYERSTGKGGSGLTSQSAGAEMFREWTRVAQSIKATDIHLRILEGGKGEVMVRVDGTLEPIPDGSGGLFTELDVKNAIKAAYEVLSDRHSNNQGAFSETSTLSSMIDAALQIPDLRLRFSSIPGLYGPKSVCRLLSNVSGENAMSFETMGFAPSHIAMFDRAQRLQAGAIGQMGVTGSGKTTAAKTFVETHPGYGSMAMYQIADPIEYPIAQMHQIYVQRSLVTSKEEGKKDPFTVAIESLMRSDPDFVDVGEVRDALSARAMANVAKSGHMSLFTLHADSLAGALNRLTDPNIGLSRSELTTSNLLGMLCYQALSPVLCPHCRLNHAQAHQHHKSRDTNRDQQEAKYIQWLVEILESRFGIERERLRFRNPQGCEHCRSRGTKGLTICAEMLMPENGWLDLSAIGKDRDAIRWWRHEYSDRDLLSPNMDGKLVSEHAMFKAAQGLIDPREIERFTQLQSLEVLKK
ncbi:GspE/PulE family protein [Hydrogenophaga sp. NFH-34]|uniref:GspE/PulE family protein n=1 Tax=Hydrogenophaga sp. NFH-34 TaxID=2744446 RepID=UPI001F2AE5BF|nr:ATPase, T2SS/T4P/T4SS family [Hydrogenophaga sp. NFH-34]